MKLTIRRVLETGAMLMVGDALLALIAPNGHVNLWRRGPNWWRLLISPFVGRPDRTRAYGLVELFAGVALALSVEPGRRDAQRSESAEETRMRAS